MRKAEGKTDKTKIRVLGLVLVHTRITLHAQARLCAHGFLPRSPRNIAKLWNAKSNILTCFLDIQKRKPRLHKYIITYYNKKIKQKERLKKKEKEKEKKSLD